MEDYIDSLNLDNVTFSDPKATISSPKTVFERGYDKEGRQLYTRKYDGEDLSFIAITILNDKRQIIAYQRLSHIKLVNHYLIREEYTYDDEDRLIYFKSSKGLIKSIRSEWEKYKYVDNKNFTHLTYRNSNKDHVKIKMDKDNNILDYIDHNHNWWSGEVFKNTKCPFNIIPLEKKRITYLEKSF